LEKFSKHYQFYDDEIIILTEEGI